MPVVNTLKQPTLVQILEETLGRQSAEEIEKDNYLVLTRERIERFYSDEQLRLAAKTQKKPTEELLTHLGTYGICDKELYADAAMRMHRMETWTKENLLGYVQFAVRSCDESHYNVMDNSWAFIFLQHAFYALQKNYNMTISQVFEEAGKIRTPLMELFTET